MYDEEADQKGYCYYCCKTYVYGDSDAVAWDCFCRESCEVAYEKDKGHKPLEFKP